MAQTQTQTHENAPVPAPNGTDNTDQTAWCEAAKIRKYRTNDGVVYGYGSGIIVPVPAPKGFAAIEPLVQPFVFQAIMQMVMNRVVQNADGDVASKVAAVLTNGQGTPGVQSNDAFDAAYLAHIEALVEAKLGKYTHRDGVELKGDALKTAKLARDKIVASNAEHGPTKEKHFLSSVKAAIEAGRNVPVTKEKKRVAKAVDEASILAL
jgi:hypothetical protein